jgi:hypothetical protein
MRVTIADLKTHVAAFIAKEAADLDGEVHHLVARFDEFVEGKQAIADATAYLVAQGFTVTGPPTTV